ncbi:MAG: GNAT family N-acetyltransferase [Actinomycetota bacterium]
MSTPPEIAPRIRAFQRELERRCAGRTEATAFGTAYLHLGFPRRYDSNFVWVERPLAGVNADMLAADADSVLGEAGLQHRKVSVDDDLHGRRLAAEFLELGWTAERLLVMWQAREPEPRPPADVREVGFLAARPFLEEVLARQPYADDEETCRQLTDFRAVLEERANARFHLATVDDRPASVCERYELDGVAQVEDVNTLEEFRGRGLASAVVLAAAAAARSRGCDLVFLVAADDDWPKDLYARLGFDEANRSWSFASAPS